MILHNRLRVVLDYTPPTGVFTWKVRTSNRIHVGCVAGSFNSYGYIQIVIDGGHYLGHRLAWFFVTGQWPPCEIDHRDGNPANNIFANLRLATHRENLRNTRRPAHNTSGIKGVSWSCDKQKWRSSVTVDGRAVHLGYFTEKSAAQMAYQRAISHNFGEFANPGFVVEVRR